jgi:hypothetical protein
MRNRRFRVICREDKGRQILVEEGWASQGPPNLALQNYDDDVLVGFDQQHDVIERAGSCPCWSSNDPAMMQRQWPMVVPFLVAVALQHGGVFFGPSLHHHTARKPTGNPVGCNMVSADAICVYDICIL